MLYAPLKGIRVLVVDDDADTREFIAFLLEQQGAIVAIAASANEALAMMAQSKPDLLLSDLGMPEVDGYALIRKLRAMPDESKVDRFRRSLLLLTPQKQRKNRFLQPDFNST